MSFEGIWSTPSRMVGESFKAVVEEPALAASFFFEFFMMEAVYHNCLSLVENVVKESQNCQKKKMQ